MALTFQKMTPLFQAFDLPTSVRFYRDLLGFALISAAYRHFTEQDVQARPPKTQAYGMRQVYLKDPDGYALCFHWPVREPSP
jgi:hypothetical protein